MYKGLHLQKFYIGSTPNTPEIHLSPEEYIFQIRGKSSPEDVRKLYYPVIEWIKIFIDDILEGEISIYSPENPLKFQIDLEFFNSSSAKFIYDILLELKRHSQSGIPVNIEWHHDYEDIGLKEAGADLALLAEMEFTYVPKIK